MVIRNSGWWSETFQLHPLIEVAGILLEQISSAHFSRRPRTDDKAIAIDCDAAAEQVSARSIGRPKFGHKPEIVHTAAVPLEKIGRAKIGCSVDIIARLVPHRTH